MINILLIRKTPKFDDNFCHGDVFIRDSGNKRWLEFGYSLEDKVRDLNMNSKFDGDEVKEYGKTAIAIGIYDGVMTYSPHFKKRLPLLLNVAEFKYIRIHGGNNILDTLGCILVGYDTNYHGKIWNSNNAIEDLIKLIENNDEEGRFTIKII